MSIPKIYTQFIDGPLGLDLPIFGIKVLTQIPSPITPTPTASSIPATPTPTPTESSVPATPTPTPTSSSVPATPTPTPTSSSAPATPTPTPSSTPSSSLPSDISGLFWWYDASNTSGMITGGTSLDMTIISLEGRQSNGGDFPVIAIDNHEPELNTDSIGYYINFNGGPERLGLTINEPEVLSAMTKFLVFTKEDSISLEEMMVEIGSDFRSHYYFTNYSESQTFFSFDYPGPILPNYVMLNR
jgi:hypothetical protein